MILRPHEVIADAVLTYCQMQLAQGYDAEVLCIELGEQEGSAAFRLANSGDGHAVLLATVSAGEDAAQWWLLTAGDHYREPRCWVTVEPALPSWVGRHAALQRWQDEGPAEAEQSRRDHHRDQRTIHGPSFIG